MYIKSKELISLLECDKKYEIEKLSLKTENMRYRIFSETIREMTKAIARGQEIQKIRELIYDFFETHYKSDWFLLSWQKKKAVQSDVAIFDRFLNNLPISGEERISAQVEFVTAYPLEHNDRKFSHVKGKADLLLEEEEGAVTGIIIHRKYPKPYSYRASKSENKVYNSLELLFLLHALTIKYPDRPVSVKMVSLYSKMDKEGVLEEFDKKPGDNMIGFSLEEYIIKGSTDLISGIEKAISEAQPRGCRNCPNEELCKPANKVFLRKTSVKDEESEGKINMQFTKAQTEVIEHMDGPIRVCAGPGSGKTATLVARVQRLIEKGIRPEEILAITFTKKAAKELLERVGAEEKPYISTLHSLAYQLLMEHAYLVGELKLVSKVDCMNLLLSILNNAALIRNVSYEGLTMPYGLIPNLLKDFEFIDRNGEQAFHDAFEKKDIEGVLNVKRIYELMFRNAGYITFDDQISMAVKLLSDYEGVRRNIRERFSYILVDEVQDLDEEQTEFVRLLTDPINHNLMICGDADQSIYAFRGGSNKFMLDFMEIYPTAREAWLNDNFRSSKEILEVAESLIINNENRIPMPLKASFSADFKAIHIRSFHPAKAGLLIKDIVKKGYRYGDIAIIARNNKDLLKICDMLELYSSQAEPIPFEKPKYYLYEDYVFQSILDLLELYMKGLNQDLAVYRLLFGLGCRLEKNNPSLSLYQDYLERNMIYDFHGVENQLYYMVTENDEPVLQAFSKIYQALQMFKLPLKESLELVIKFFFDHRINTTEVMEKIMDMMFERQINRPEELYSLLKSIRLFRDDTRLSYHTEGDNMVRLLTAHESKGKEFQVVIVYGIDEFEKGEDLEEERRVLYVALTRAKRVLFTTEICHGKSNFLREFQDKMSVQGGNRYE